MKYGQPNAEVAKVSQKSQKKTMKDLLKSFCDFCVVFVFLLRSDVRIRERIHG
ncbi:hypothetical protein M2165_001664 [Variovorax sp. TBS-050B]|nr:hypothetical protein [Variovorax sp. TBS-050B]